MPNTLRKAIGRFCHILVPEHPGSTDGELLARFATQGDKEALAVLIHRHAHMVWGVCLRMLRNRHDAEDAFQASFLVLVRKASSIRERDKVANWLHGVARQTSVRLKSILAKRNAREKPSSATAEPAVTEPDLEDRRWMLDEEIDRLPEKYRLVVVLCDIEERTRAAVAQQLGCPEGTIASRLARARVMLGDRLRRRGWACSEVGMAAMLASTSCSAGAGKSVVSSTITAANALVSGHATTGLVSPVVLLLTEGVLHTMFLTKLKVSAVVVLGLIASTAVLLGTENRADPRIQDDPKQIPAAQANSEAWWNDLASNDEAKASRALLAFSSDPKAATAFFKERLRPVKVDADKIRKLAAQIDNGNFGVRDAATKNLREEVDNLGRFAKPVLEEYLKSEISLEARRRIETILAQIPRDAKSAEKAAVDPPPVGRNVSVRTVNGQVQIVIDGTTYDLAAVVKKSPDHSASPFRPWLRAVRAIALLESFRTPEARMLLESLAIGEPEAAPTQEALNALKRLPR